MISTLVSGAILTCPEDGCTYETFYPRKLEAHREWHAGVRPEVCAVCGDAFVNEKYLTRHSKLHNGNSKQYRCQWCEYTTLRSDKLRDHIKNAHRTVARKLDLYTKGTRGRKTKYDVRKDDIDQTLCSEVREMEKERDTENQSQSCEDHFERTKVP